MVKAGRQIIIQGRRIRPSLRLRCRSDRYAPGKPPAVVVIRKTIMRKNTVNKILNPILLILALNQVITAIIRDVPEHAGSTSMLSDEAFEFFHEGGGFILAGLIVLHIILNFGWVRRNYFS